MTLSSAQEQAALVLLTAGAGEISLAGGSALIVHGLVDRTTKDLDAFAASLKADLPAITDRVQTAFSAAGYEVEDRSRSSSLTVLMVSRPAPPNVGRPRRSVQIEIGADHQALPSLPSRLGPILDPYELGANKILTVYDRTRPRDADDLAKLVLRLDFGRMLAIADSKMVERLNRQELAECFRSFQRVDTSEFPIPAQADRIKEFTAKLADALEFQTPFPRSPYRA